MTVIESWIICIFDAIFVVIIVRKILKKKPIMDFHGVLLIAVLSVTLTVATTFVNESINIIIDTVILLIGLQLYFRLSFYKTLILGIIFNVVTILLQFVLLFPIFIIFGEVQLVFSQAIVAQSFALICVVLIYYFIPINVIYEFAIRKNRIVKGILINIFVLLICVLLYFYMNIQGFTENALVLVGVALILVVLNGIIIKNGLINEHEKRQLKLYESYLPIMKRLTNEIRKRQHDFNNHIQTVNAIVNTSKSLQDIKSQVETYSKEIKHNQLGEEFLNINNKILAGFIYSKYCEITERGVLANFNIQNTLNQGSVKDYDLVEIIGILLDNAKENANLSETINLIIFSVDSLNIIVKNLGEYISQEKLRSWFSEGYSTKGANRGLGLIKLNEIVKKYKGEILFENEQTEKQQNIVVFHILIPLVMHED